MNDYAKKVLATVLFPLLFTGSGKNVSSMECIEEKIEQVNVKSTIDLVNKFEKLNDASIILRKLSLKIGKIILIYIINALKN